MKINKLTNIIFMSILSIFTINNFAMEQNDSEIKNETVNNNSYFSRFKSYVSGYINPKSIYSNIKNKLNNMKNYVSNYVNKDNKYAKYTLAGAALATTGYVAYKYWKHKNNNAEIEDKNTLTEVDINELIEDFTSIDNNISLENNIFLENVKEEINKEKTDDSDSKVLEDNQSLDAIKIKIFEFFNENLGALDFNTLTSINNICDNDSNLDLFIAQHKDFPYSNKSLEENIEIFTSFFQNK